MSKPDPGQSASPDSRCWPQCGCSGTAQAPCSRCRPSGNPHEIGWRCDPCGWETFDLADMHNLVNWRNPDGSISLVCPACGAEGQFVDAERGRP